MPTQFLSSMSGLTVLILALPAAATPAGSPPESVPGARGQGAESKTEVSVLAGLIQPIVLAGGNIEVDVHWRRLALGYSHGFMLDLSGSTVVGEAKKQGLAFALPYSTGISAGYRLSSWLDLRAELKAHRFRVRYDGQPRGSTPLFSYTTWTLGAGAYARWRPFASSGWPAGIVTSTSLRWWPNIASTLGDGGAKGKRTYMNRVTGKTETHEAANIGIAGTPIIFNISVGYTFDI